MDKDRIDEIMNKYQGDASALIQALLEIQRENRWLTKEALEQVSEKLKVPLSRIQHVATFYKAFSLVPRGRHEIHACNGTSCHVRGSPHVVETVQDLIGIRPGETAPDSKFSLETVTCRGCCAMGPVMVVDGEHHAEMTPAKAEDVLKSYD